MRLVHQDLKAFAEAVKKLAFSMPAPNEFTPQFVQIALEAERLAMRHADEPRGQFRRLLRNMPDLPEPHRN